MNQETGKIAYEDTGKGPLVVCVPSLGDVRGEYRFLIPQLVSKDIIALIRELGAGPAIIVGTSMAAGAAVWAAAEAPELVRGVVMIGPFVRGDGNWFLETLFSVMFARPWGPAMWVKYYSSLYPSQKPADFNEYSAGLLRNLKEPGRLESLMQMLRASKRASEERIPRVGKPALVLMGSRDPDFRNPESEAEWVAENLKGTYIMIENAGHYPHAEMPEVTGPLILKFIASLPEMNQEMMLRTVPKVLEGQ
jgi:pimeloyl-ACP methyl ester carboxylesterase